MVCVSAKTKCLKVREEVRFSKMALKVDRTYGTVNILISSVTSTEKKAKIHFSYVDTFELITFCITFSALVF